MEDRNCWSLRQFLLKGPCTDLLGLTPSELQYGASRLKGIRDIQGRNPLSGIRERARGQTEVLAEVIVPFLSTVPPTQSHRTGKWTHIQDSMNLAHYLPCPGDSLRPCSTQYLGPPKLFPVAFPYEWLSWLMIHIFLYPLKQAALGFSEPHTSHQVAPGLAQAAANLGSQFSLAWATPNPAQIAAIHRLLFAHAM